MPAINPREPLTKKARAAIQKYAAHHGEKYHYMQHYMIDLVLKAERMKRVDLYAKLESYGYRWYSKRGFWDKPRVRK